MKKRHIIKFTVMGLLAVVCTAVWGVPVSADTIRPAVFAGRFYPADGQKLRTLIESLNHRAQQSPVALPAQKQLRAVIMPHAGIIYSGWTAAHAGWVLRPGQFRKVVLIGPDHRVGFTNAAVSTADAWQTPLGPVRLHSDCGVLRQNRSHFQAATLSDRVEHSLEAVLPFLQFYLKSFELVPIVLGPCSATQMAAALDPLLDDGSLLVISSDLSHFLPYPQAVARDRKTIRQILELDSDALLRRQNVACGVHPLRLVITLARMRGWQPVLLHAANSGDTAGDRDRVVGYTTIAFFGDAPMTTNPTSKSMLAPEQGQVLVRLARQTIAHRLGDEVPQPDAEAVDEALKDAVYARPGATFVTLKKKGRLRGCIGCLSAYEPLRDNVRRNAVSAAFDDPRFSALSPPELTQIRSRSVSCPNLSRLFLTAPRI